MERVLFVDDEQNILSGLKRTMRVMRDEWDMEFIDDPQAALKAFAEHPFDVVVSDMKMPSLDGADLLCEIQRLYPATIRIILSGHADSAMIMKSIGSTHQYLVKPCEPDLLKSTVRRAYALREMVNNSSLQTLVSELGDLPSIPSVYQEVVATIQEPDASLQDVARVIEKDLGMTAKILQLVNSAFFGVANPVATIDRAVSFLGLDTIGSLVLGHGVFSAFQADGLSGLDLESLWHQSAMSAEYAKAIANEEGQDSKMAEEAFLAGMLSDVGLLILASKQQTDFLSLLEKSPTPGIYPSEVEKDLFGCGHGAIGAYLVGLWGLPDSIVEAIAFHEKPSECAATELGLPGIVHAANRLAVNADGTPDDPSLAIDRDYLIATNTLERWPVWQERIGERAND